MLVLVFLPISLLYSGALVIHRTTTLPHDKSPVNIFIKNISNMQKKTSPLLRERGKN